MSVVYGLENNWQPRKSKVDRIGVLESKTYLGEEG